MDGVLLVRRRLDADGGKDSLNSGGIPREGRYHATAVEGAKPGMRRTMRAVDP
jgi:hypothetical protein